MKCNLEQLYNNKHEGDANEGQNKKKPFKGLAEKFRFSKSAGFLTVSVKWDLLKIKRTSHERMDENFMQGSSGLLFGEKKDSDIEIKKLFKINKIISENDIFFELSGWTLIGIYSVGDICNQKDVDMLKVISKKYKSTFFLLKFDWSPTCLDVPLTMYEAGYDTDGRFLLVQLFHNQERQNYLNKKQLDEDSESSSKVFYISQDKPHFLGSCKYDPESKAKIMESLKSELLNLRHKVAEYLKQKNMSWEDLKKPPLEGTLSSNERKDVAKKLHTLVRDLDLELTFDFCFFGKVLCDVNISCNTRVTSGDSIEESHLAAALGGFDNLFRLQFDLWP